MEKTVKSKWKPARKAAQAERARDGWNDPTKRRNRLEGMNCHSTSEVKTLRLALGMNQKEFAAQVLKISAKNAKRVSIIESGAACTPTNIQNMETAAAAAGISFIYTGQRTPTRNKATAPQETS